MKRMKCYIYTRVSTSMQVDGYSLDAQKDKLRKYAEFQNMLVAGEYCDEGKSGKNIEGRPEFLRMLRDIEACNGCRTPASTSSAWRTASTPPRTAAS